MSYLEQRIPRIPIRRKRAPVGIHQVLIAPDLRSPVGDLILRLSGFMIRADRAAFIAVASLAVEETRVDAACDVEAVAVVGGDDHEGVVEFADFFEVRHGGFDGIVELEEFAESAVVVEEMHLFVDGRGFGHEEEAVVGVLSFCQNMDGNGTASQAVNVSETYFASPAIDWLGFTRNLLGCGGWRGL